MFLSYRWELFPPFPPSSAVLNFPVFGALMAYVIGLGSSLLNLPSLDQRRDDFLEVLPVFGGHGTLGVCQTARDDIDRARLARLRG